MNPAPPVTRIGWLMHIPCSRNQGVDGSLPIVSAAQIANVNAHDDCRQRLFPRSVIMSADDTMMTVATFDTLMEAELARSYLEGEGIRCFLADAEMVNT